MLFLDVLQSLADGLVAVHFVWHAFAKHREQQRKLLIDEFMFTRDEKVLVQQDLRCRARKRPAEGPLEEMPARLSTKPRVRHPILCWGVDVQHRDLVIGLQVGLGISGGVFAGVFSRRRVAIKTLRAPYDDGRKFQRVISEIQAARLMNCAFVAKLLHVIVVPGPTSCFEATCLYALADSDLFNYILDRDLVPETRALELCRDAAKGLQYCHSLGYAHCDIKPENYLVTFGALQLTDFGSGRCSTDVLFEYSTLAYSAPELLAPPVDGALQCLDCWSLGAVLYFITERTPPFMFEIGQELLLADNIRHAYYETRSAPSWARELIKSLLQPRAQLRRTATDVLVVLSKVVVSPFATSHLLHDGSNSKVRCVAPSRSSSQEHPLSCMQQEFRDSGFEGFKVWG